MQTETAKMIYERVKVLPPESQREVLSFVDNLKTKSEENTPSAESGLKKLWREIDEIVASVPNEAWDDVPTDGSINVDHYLYGARKRQK